MPRAKKVNSQYAIKKPTKIDKSNIRISAKRKHIRRKNTDRRKKPSDIFWNKVIEGFKKLLSPAFKD